MNTFAKNLVRRSRRLRGMLAEHRGLEDFNLKQIRKETRQTKTTKIIKRRLTQQLTDRIEKQKTKNQKITETLIPLKTAQKVRDIRKTKKTFLNSLQDEINEHQRERRRHNKAKREHKQRMELLASEIRYRANDTLTMDSESTAKMVDNMVNNLMSVHTTKSRKYGVENVEYSMRTNAEMPVCFDAGSSDEIIDLFFTELIKKMTKDVNIKPDDKMRIIIQDVNSDHPISTKFMKASDFDIGSITDIISKYIQSGRTFYITDAGITLQLVVNPKGGHYSIITKLEDYYEKKSYIKIKNNDDYCFVHCLSLALKHLEYKKGLITSVVWKHSCQQRYSNKKQVNEIYAKAGIEKKQVALTDIKSFEDAFKVTINIIDFAKKNQCIYPNDLSKQYDDQIFFHLANNHYNLITDIEAFSGVHNGEVFCHACKSLTAGTHKCKNGSSNMAICSKCMKPHQHSREDEDERIGCLECLMTFENDACFNNYLFKICKTIGICKNCDKFVNGDRTLSAQNTYHQCGMEKCDKCKCFKEIGHDCFISQVDSDTIKNQNKKVKGIIFYDYETYVDPLTKEHVPNAACVQRHKDNEVTKHKFTNNTDFCEWLFTKENEGFTCIAHYSRGFDIHFIKQYLYNSEANLKFSCIDTGLKTLQLHVDSLKITFIDSHSFFLCPLRKLPETFGLVDVKKGYFPHFFNTKENQNYVGTYPEKSYYGYNTMNEKDSKDFDKWYNTITNDVFDFQKEFWSYCESDVDVLAKSWTAFTTLFIEIQEKIITGCKVKYQNNLESLTKLTNPNNFVAINPTSHITIAGLVSQIYRAFFMPSKSINIIKECNQNASVAEQEWLLHLEKQVLGRPLDRQRKIGRYFVDGFDETTNTVYEFNGCYWHGCKYCYKDRNRMNHTKKNSMQQLLIDTKRKEEKLIKMGYKVVTIWEHAWKKERKQHLEFLSINETILRETDLRIRKSFFGGRTEVFSPYAKSTGDEEIGYADFTSLYPSIQALAEYPIGVGRYIKSDFETVNNYFGFVYCKVTPPKGLHIPILPHHNEKDGKLVFDLAPKIGTWFTGELQNAINNGYVVEEIYQIYHYDQHDTSLFKEFVTTFGSIKTENQIKTAEEGKNALLENETSRLRLELDETKFCYNPGLRFITKIVLNSLWGKFAQRHNMMKTVIIKDSPKEFYKYMFDEKYVVSSILFLTEDTIELKYKLDQEEDALSSNTNIAIASVTTGWARTWLYNAMQKVGTNNVIYADTDSIIYKYQKGNNPVKTDSCFGGMTDELDDTYITEIAAMAPKTYSYKTSDGKVVVKAKGFTLNKNTSIDINFDSMKNTILNENKKEVVIKYDNQIRMNGKTKNLQSVDVTKTFKFNFTKRQIDLAKSSDSFIMTTPFI